MGVAHFLRVTKLTESGATFTPVALLTSGNLYPSGNGRNTHLRGNIQKCQLACVVQCERHDGMVLLDSTTTYLESNNRQFIPDDPLSK